jgi:glutamyl-tRNA reductase
MTTLPQGPRAEDTSLVMVGIDFRSAELELRERVAMREDEGEAVLVEVMARPEIAEAYLLSTCNRTELYLVAREHHRAFSTALELFARRAPEVADEGRFFVLHDREAARRLLSVATGLESMVLGEPEILGQVRSAAALAERVGSTGTVLQQLVHHATVAGKRARSETAIGEGAVSLGYATVDLARQIFGGLGRGSLLLVGAGETAELVAHALAERGIDEVRFVNRSDDRAASFHRRFPTARRISWGDMPAALEKSDAVVTTTSAPEPIFTRHELREIMERRRSRALLLVDLGVPRNVEAAAGELDNLFLHDLDSLQSLVDRNLDRRREEIPRVEAIVADELQRFTEGQRRRDAEPVVASLQRRAEDIRRREVAAVREAFPEELHPTLDNLTRSLVRKILHHPSHQLRRGLEHGERAQLELARELFQLDDEDESP